MHKATPTNDVSSPTMTGSRAVGGLLQRVMGLELSVDKMRFAPGERL